MPNKYILRFRQIDKRVFKDIKTGKKTVETRAATIKFKNIILGDIIVFVCGKEKFKKKVKRVQTFKSIFALLDEYKVKDIMPHLSSREELEKSYYKYPNYKEKIKKFGLIVLELE